MFGAALAQNRAVNAEDPSERTNLEIVIVNDLNNQSTAAEVATALTKLQVGDQRSVRAVIGHYTSPITCKVLPIYSEVGIVVMSSTSTLTDLRQKCNDSNQIFFRTTSSAEIEAKVWTAYLQNRSNLDSPKIALFYTKGEDYSENLREQFEDQLSRGTVSKFDLSNQNFDAEQALENAESADILAVFPDGGTDSSVAFNRAIEVIKGSNGEKLILGSNPLYGESVIQASGGGQTLHNKLLIAVDWDSDCGASPDFNTYAQEIWLGPANRLVALSYEAVQVLAAPLKSTQTWQALRNRLKNIEVNSDVFSQKRISFEQDGDRNSITNRIIVTPRQTGPGFVPIDGQFCQS
ncbi:MAG: ABC transporter substrate-binding protein [Leptolyngbya sp. SIO4C1]|nr:ABC transporter substrate-binding protein [Leptolyngbya sp. SIO4C1]